ncbi:hypothetical protein CRM22_005031, partial [Opisthorchis felineus]
MRIHKAGRTRPSTIILVLSALFLSVESTFTVEDFDQNWKAFLPVAIAYLDNPGSNAADIQRVKDAYNAIATQPLPIVEPRAEGILPAVRRFRDMEGEFFAAEEAGMETDPTTLLNWRNFLTGSDGVWKQYYGRYLTQTAANTNNVPAIERPVVQP